jgi:hypothetical protein
LECRLIGFRRNYGQAVPEASLQVRKKKPRSREAKEPGVRSTPRGERVKISEATQHSDRGPEEDEGEDEC